MTGRSRRPTSSCADSQGCATTTARPTEPAVLPARALPLGPRKAEAARVPDYLSRSLQLRFEPVHRRHHRRQRGGYFGGPDHNPTTTVITAQRPQVNGSGAGLPATRPLAAGGGICPAPVPNAARRRPAPSRHGRSHGTQQPDAADTLLLCIGKGVSRLRRRGTGWQGHWARHFLTHVQGGCRHGGRRGRSARPPPHGRDESASRRGLHHLLRPALPPRPQ